MSYTGGATEQARQRIVKEKLEMAIACIKEAASECTTPATYHLAAAIFLIQETIRAETT